MNMQKDTLSVKYLASKNILQSKSADCKSAGIAFSGSNPLLPSSFRVADTIRRMTSFKKEKPLHGTL